MDDSISTLSQSFAAAPSALASNTLVISTPSERALVELGHRLDTRTRALLKTLTSIEEASKDVAVALTEMRAAATLAEALVDTENFVWSNLDRKTANERTAKLTTLRDKAVELLNKADDKTPRKNGRDLASSLDDSVKEDSRILRDLLLNPDLNTTITNYTTDDAVNTGTRVATISDFRGLQARAILALERTERAEDLKNLAEQVFAQMDRKSSPFAVAMAERNRLLDALGYGSQATTSVIGNLPGPDTATLALMKLYAAIKIQDARTWVNPAAADSLESELTAWILDAMHLTEDMQKDVRGRIKEMSAATQKKVKAQGFGKPNYLANKEAEEFVKAERVANFYKEHDEVVFKDFQSGPGFDCFISILTIIQFGAALKAYFEAEDPNSRQTFDVTATGALAGTAVITTIGRLAKPGEGLAASSIELGSARKSLANLGEVCEGAGKLLGVVGGVMAIVDGASDIVEGKAVSGGLNVASGTSIVVGLLMGGAWGAAASGFGALLGIGLAGYALYELADESLKPSTQRAMENLINSLKTRPAKWTGKPIVESLGLAANLASLEDASNDVSYFTARREPNGGSPTRAELIEQLSAAGWKDDAKLMVESEDDEKKRVELANAPLFASPPPF